MGTTFLMPIRSIVLASASPSRKRLLESCGITPEIIVSGVNEEDPQFESLSPSELVLALAILKAHTVKEQVGTNALIIGCDSTFEFEGKSLGKPLTAEVAIARAKALRGKTGVLHTGHCIIDTAQGIEVADISSAAVTFADMSDAEIEAYVASGEPLNVAGGFTLDGLSAPFIEHIAGDPSGIVGLSLPLLRRAINELGLSWPQIAEMVVKA
jgi:septum formation protein